MAERHKGEEVKDRNAFPETSDQQFGVQHLPGMALREYYAGQALVGVFSADDLPHRPEAVANMCVQFADALIAKLAE